MSLEGLPVRPETCTRILKEIGRFLETPGSDTQNDRTVQICGAISARPYRGDVCAATPRGGGVDQRPRRRVIENKHSTDIGARLTFRVNAHTDARRRRRRFNVDRVLVLNSPHTDARRERDASACMRRHQAFALAPVQTRGEGGGDSTSVECLLSTTPLPRYLQVARSNLEDGAAQV